MMKKMFAILLLLGLRVAVMAQGVPCYSLNMQVAQVEFDQQQYAKALQHFMKAKACAGGDTADVCLWIEKCWQKMNMPAEEPAVVTPAASPEERRAETHPEPQATPQEVSVPEEVAEEEPEMKEDPSATGYMKIQRVEFANYKNGSYLSSYGETLYASDMRYLVFKIFYDGLDSKSRHDITFRVKLIDTQGRVVSGKGAPEGFTAAYEMTVSTNKGKNEEFPCRGRGDTSIYRPGNYQFEVWYADSMIYAQTLTLLAKAGEPTYLTVEGEPERLVQRVRAGGERKVYSVGTDAANFRLEGINERWVSVEYLPGNQFAVTFKPDYSKELSPYGFRVRADYMSVEVEIQYSREGDLLWERAWDESLTRSMDVYNLRSELDVVYKGELTKREKCDGYGVNMWPNGAFYYGSFVNNHREGKGLYTIPQNQQLNHAAYYVGEYGSTGLRNGQGRLYDVYGNLIYDGPFFADRPQGAVPMEGCDTRVKFACERYSNDAMYLGETLDGVRHGYGIYVYPNGDLWCGQWDHGTAGEGFYSYRKVSGATPGAFK